MVIGNINVFEINIFWEINLTWLVKKDLFRVVLESTDLNKGMLVYFDAGCLSCAINQLMIGQTQIKNPLLRNSGRRICKYVVKEGG